MLRFFVIVFFSASLILFGVFSQLIPILYSSVLLGILSGLGLYVVLKGTFFEVFNREYCVYSMC